MKKLRNIIISICLVFVLSFNLFLSACKNPNSTSQTPTSETPTISPSIEEKIYMAGTTLSSITILSSSGDTEGSYSWDTPSQILSVGENTCKYTFTPTSSNYKSTSGSLTIVAYKELDETGFSATATLKYTGSVQTLSPSSFITNSSFIKVKSVESEFNEIEIGTYSIQVTIMADIDKYYVFSSSSNTITINATVNIISEEDYNGSYNVAQPTGITYSETGITLTNENGNVEVNGNIATIVSAGEYNVSGVATGRLVVTVTDGEVEINLMGLTLTSSEDNPIYIECDDNVDISAKGGYENYIYDTREYVENAKGAGIYAKADLKLKGTGTLNVEAKFYNNGIATTKDLTIKNPTLNVTAYNNAIKGNNSLTIESGKILAISTGGDALKTEDSSVTKKGKQKGTITITGGTIYTYAACDAIDAAYNAEISGNPVIYVYTDKYSEYSGEVTATSTTTMYLKTSNQTYNYSVYFYNSDGTSIWENAIYSSFNRYYLYTLEKPSNYSYMIIYAYTNTQSKGQSEAYAYKSDSITVNSNYDTASISVSNNKLKISWTNYTTQQGPGGISPGGMQDGNTDKGDYSTKGIKADNEIIISGGIINIKSYDDAIHANSDTELENGSYGTGNITISGGSLNLYSNDDGIHADGLLTINEKTSSTIIAVTNSYEGIEGSTIIIDAGTISVISSDDGINSITTSGDGITINGGNIYVYAGGDGVDGNTKTQYAGIIFNGGKTVVISTSSGNSCLDTEKGYTYNAGYVIAMCPTGMQSESYNVKNGASNYGKYTTMSLSGYVQVSGVAVIKLPKTISNGFIICLGSTSVSFSTITSATNYTFDSNGVCWLI